MAEEEAPIKLQANNGQQGKGEREKNGESRIQPHVTKPRKAEVKFVGRTSSREDSFLPGDYFAPLTRGRQKETFNDSSLFLLLPEKSNS